MDLFTAMLASRCTCYGITLSMGHSPFRGIPAVLWAYPQPQMLRGVLAWPYAQPLTLQGVPALAWTYPQLQMLRGDLLPHGFINRSQSLRLKFTLEFQHFQYSSTETAAMPWLPASPSAWPLLLSQCSQAQQSKMISSTANSKSKKQPLTSTRY